MTVSIDRLDIDLDLGGAPAEGSGAGRARLSERDLIERLRPLIREIIRQELDQLRREHGR